ncbi:MAG TPA: tRNA uridine-5-carboxymethylaminomethyl(34) synthesis GTPase MnmE, partial [Caulobacteraceae bacterium]
MNDTVFALATAPGRAAVAVIRISGPAARSALEAVVGGRVSPRRASVRTLRGQDGKALDRGLALWFPGPASYTGEDCAELQVHGSAAVVDQCTEVLLARGLRLAAPGEFTRRAFENGKLDLDQAEAVADLVDAETAAQARQALGQLEGRLGARYRTWRDRLVEAIARLEAAVDFPDEEVPADVAEEARGRLAALAADLDVAVDDEPRGRRVRDGYRVAVIGAPNSGKSSLVNALIGRDAAIVTDIAGTTRDIIEAPLVLDGFKVILADTAGLRATAEPIETEGVRRARSWAQGADLRLWVVDQAASAEAWREAEAVVRADDLCILNKADLPQGADACAARGAAEARGLHSLELSIVRDGADAVRALLSERVRRDLSGADFPAATQARHQGLLRAARDHVRRALGALETPELAAEDARLAARALAQVAGRVG